MRVDRCARVALAATLALLSPARADEPKEAPPPPPVELPSVRWLVLPNAFYTPDTGVAAGLAGVLLLDVDRCPTCRTSVVTAGFAYTQREQYFIGMTPELYLDENRWQILGNVRYYHFPGRFYGIGNDTSSSSVLTYTPEGVTSRVEVRRVLFGPFFAGLRADAEVATIEDSVIDPSITGSAGAKAFGLGPTIAWDDRDAILYPTRGHFHQVSAVYYARGFGSDYGFARYNADLRTYIGLGDRRVLALNAVAQLGSGDVPFTALPVLGGPGLMRGMFEGRFRDDVMIGAQAEFRTHVYWRFGAVVFASTGQVASSIAEIDAGSLHVAGGAGVRFLLVEKDGLNLRCDVAVSDTGWAPYLLVREAF